MSLVLESLVKSYAGSKPVLQGLSLSLRQGESYALVGPNGAGKSTTIKCVIGAVKPQSGTLAHDGKPLDQLKRRKGLSYLPENLLLPRTSTMMDYLQSIGLLKAMDPGRVAERVAELAEALGMGHAVRRRIGTFSKGMRKKVGIMQAFLAPAELIILDEPTSDLDPVARRNVLSLVAAAKAGGATILMTSHILTDLERVCDRAGLLLGGRLVSEITIADYRSDSRVATARLAACGHDGSLALRLGEELDITGGRYRFADLDYDSRDLEDWYHDCLSREGALS